MPARGRPRPSVLAAKTVDIIRRTRFEYSLDAAGLLAKVRKSIPDATAKEVERWAKDSKESATA